MSYLNKGKRKKKGNGAFGGRERDLGDYKTLKVLKRSERTPENSNKQGVQNDS